MTWTSGRARAEHQADRVAEAATAAPGADGPVDAGRAPASASATPEHVHDALASPGRAVDPLTASRFGAIGHDVGQVRIHANAAGDRSARRLGALAYTFGDDVVIRTD